MNQNSYEASLVLPEDRDNLSLQGKMMDEAMENMWLDGKISDADFAAYKSARLTADQRAAQIMFGLASVSGGGLAANGAKAILATKGGSAAISGTFGAIGATTTSLMGGERNLGNLAKASGIGFLVGAGTDLVYSPHGFWGIATATGAGNAVGGVATTYLNNPNATLSDFKNNGLKDFTIGFLSGAASAPILIYGGSSLPVQFVAGQIGLGTAVSAQGIMQVVLPSTKPVNPAITNNSNINK